MAPRTRPAAERFWLKVNKDDTSKLMAGCTAPAETTGAAP